MAVTKLDCMLSVQQVDDIIDELNGLDLDHTSAIQSAVPEFMYPLLTPSQSQINITTVLGAGIGADQVDLYTLAYPGPSDDVQEGDVLIGAGVSYFVYDSPPGAGDTLFRFDSKAGATDFFAWSNLVTTNRYHFHAWRLNYKCSSTVNKQWRGFGQVFHGSAVVAVSQVVSLANKADQIVWRNGTVTGNDKMILRVQNDGDTQLTAYTDGWVMILRPTKT